MARSASSRDGLLLGDERHAGIHLRTEKLVRLEDFHFHLHGGFLAVGLRRDFKNHAIIFAVGKGIGGDDAFMMLLELGKIVLGVVDLNLQGIQFMWRVYYTYCESFTGQW